MNKLINNLNYVFVFLVEQSSNLKYCPLNCQAGGTCVLVDSTAKCRCPRDRTGQLCEIRMFSKSFVYLYLYFNLF